MRIGKSSQRRFIQLAGLQPLEQDQGGEDGENEMHQARFTDRLYEIDQQFRAETRPQNRATGGAVIDPVPAALARARASEQLLWDAIGVDRIGVWTPGGPQPLSAITDFVSDIRTKLRQQESTKRPPREFGDLMRLAIRFENLIKIEASRQSDREAPSFRSGRGVG